MSRRQAAIVLSLLAMLYAVTLILCAPQVDLIGQAEAAYTPFGSSVPTVEKIYFFDWLVGMSIGCIIASPAFLAIWAIHGRERASVRLPFTAWLSAMFLIAAAYGESRYFGVADADIVALAVTAWLAFSLAMLVSLRLLRVVRGWRLQRIETAVASAKQIDSANAQKTPQPQFTIRTLLCWTFALAALCAGLRWLAPFGAFYVGELPANMIEGVLVEGVVFGLILAVASLPVVSVVLIILADGRRTIWRCALAAITVIGIAGGIYVFDVCFNEGYEQLSPLALAVETGVLLAATLAASVVRACGYRMVRARDPNAAPAVSATLNPSFVPRQFRLTLVPLASMAILLAVYAPQRIESWRRADEKQSWATVGWDVEFNDEGHVISARGNANYDPAGSASALNQWANLTSLDLSFSVMDDEQFAMLPTMPELRELKLADTEISDAGLSRLERFPKLSSLELDRTKITDAGLSRLTALKELTFLDVSDTGITLAAVQPLTELQYLKLEGTAVDDSGLSQLDRFPNLKYLSLVRTNVTDVGLANLQVLKSLHTLDLRVTDVTDEGVDALAKLTQLKKLDLQLTGVGDAGCARLHAALPKTNVFVGANDAMLSQALSANVLTRAKRGIVRVAHLVTRLHARGNYRTRDENGESEPITVTDSGLASLAGQTTLEELDLRESAVTDAGLAALATLTTLKRLDLRGSQVSETGCADLAKSLPNCTIVR